MTTEPNNHEFDDIDELTGKWFDIEPEDSASSEHGKSFNKDQIRRAAQLQLVHSLLLQLADKDEVVKESRIQSLMQKIDSNNKISEKFYRLAIPLIRYGIAAGFIIAVIFLFTQIPTNTAMAAIDQMIVAIDHAGDRTYSIKVEDEQKGRQPPPRPPQQRREKGGERAELDGATLYLRGNNQFVLYWLTPSGKTVINGSDGQTNWHIRPDKPVLVSNNPEAFRIPMSPELAAILSLDLKATLIHIRDNYKVKYLEDIAGDQKKNDQWTYLDAQKISKDFPGPKNIEIWADSQTGLLLRIEFADIHLEDDHAPKRLIIELVDQKQLSDDWFTRQAHHTQDAEVDFVSE